MDPRKGPSTDHPFKGWHSHPENGGGVVIAFKLRQHVLIMCIILCTTTGTKRQGVPFANYETYFGTRKTEGGGSCAVCTLQ